MKRQLNWVLSGGAEARETGSRALRRNLALTTILAVTPFLGYGRQAYAACTEIGATAVWECSGTSAGETISDNNADVSTLASPPFVVTTNGLFISGNGDISFTDVNASSITNTGGTGLDVRSLGNDGLIDGAVTINANSTITGSTTGVFVTNAGDGVIDITFDGQVTGQGSEGIYAFNNGDALIITTGAQSTITGNSIGIKAINHGTGNLEVRANGAVTGTNGDGIYAYNKDNGDLIIETGAQSVIKGGGDGIDARNFSDGNLFITADGQVIGTDDHGINAYNSADGVNLKITTGAGSYVYGKSSGISATNLGSGYVDITANGEVIGKNSDGINAYNSANGSYLKITTGVGSYVKGSDDGISVTNLGSGYVDITANGVVLGNGNDGINAYNSANGSYLKITTGVGSYVYGNDDGISVTNLGSGNVEITANGDVTGYNSNGIDAYNSANGADLKITTGTGTYVYGYQEGITATQRGSGYLDIKANGAVTGHNEDGIDAYNSSNGQYLTITTGADSVVTGGDDGIDAENHGSGNLEITVSGQVTGEDSDGIEATNYGDDLKIKTEAGSIVTGEGDDGIDASQYGGGDLDITANGTVTGRNLDDSDGVGIKARNYGGGETNIEIGSTGLVQGDYAGINAYNDNGQNINIANYGTVRNLSAESYDRAIITDDGATHITNNGDLIGTVETDISDPYNDTLDNNSFWNMADGTSDFGGGDDAVNNAGTLLAADDPTVEEETNINNLEEFNNDGGLVSLVDGQAGDNLHLNDGANYTGTNGRLAVDAILGPSPSGLSDELFVDGETSGKTLVHVNVVEATGANTEGIPVVEVGSGPTHDGDFVLDGPLNAGFFTWDLRRDGDVHELFTSGVGVGSFEFAAGITGAQEIWHQTTGTLLHRQADLRTLLGTGVTPVADFAEPVEPTPTAHITPGFWMRGVGAYIDRDDEENGFILDRKQTIWGGMAGFDFGTQDVDQAWLFGIFGGYLTSDLDFDETNTEWSYDGPTVGAYVTYLNHAFYADLTVKADFLDIDIDPDDLSPGSDDANTDATNIGGRIDTGYKLGETVFIEPQATLAVVHTEIDDVDIFGGTVKFDDETSVRGRLGLRLGFDQTAENQVVYSGDVTASVWEEFSGDNNVEIVDSGFPDFGVSDDPGETFGDVSVGFSMAAPEGWSGFLRANYLFADDYEAVAGNAGVRFAW